MAREESHPQKMLSFSQNLHLATIPTETKSPITNLEFPDEKGFNIWFTNENEIIEWNLDKTRSTSNSGSKLPERNTETTSKRGRPKSFEWTKYYSCSFAHIPRGRLEGNPKRTTLRLTRKLGCMAKIKVQKTFYSDTIIVTFINSHSGHKMVDLQAWTHSRMSPATRKWLEKAAASRIEWKDLKRMSRSVVERAGFLVGERLDNCGILEVPEILRIKNINFYNFRRKFLIQSAWLHSDCRQSLLKYAEKTTQAGGYSTIQGVHEKNVLDSETFSFAFSSNWQVETLIRYDSLLFLDATHNTCISLEDRSKKAFLYTILVKHDVAGCGIPAAFMITNSEAQWPLISWLNWLRQNLLVPDAPKFMIDCSATEIAAIESSLESPQIRLCHWHMLRSIQTQVNSKIKTSASIDGQNIVQIRKSAVQDFVRLIYSKTTREFGQIWSEYSDIYRQHEEWLRYIKANWLKHPERWWGSNRDGMLEINTNNYIEAWHNVLKSRYLGSYRKQRTNTLVHLPLREVMPDYRIKVARVKMGLERRRQTDSEKAQLKKCTELSSERASSLVHHSVVKVGEAVYSEGILVKSFTNEAQEYLVSLNQASTITCCSCGYMTHTKPVCKHMFLAQIVLGYSISYHTRLSQDTDSREAPLPEPVTELSPETEARYESGERAKALLLEQVGFINSYANESGHINNEEIDSLNNITAEIARIKRCRDYNEKSWSKRQRR